MIDRDTLTALLADASPAEAALGDTLRELETMLAATAGEDAPASWRSRCGISPPGST